MPFLPSFRRPCPYQANLSAVMEGSFCRMCKQQVHDITDWTDAERLALLRRCDETEVCVSYRVPVTSALAAAALVASASPAMAGHGPNHHATRPAPVQPPTITLAGAPLPPPVSTEGPPPAPRSVQPAAAVSSPAGLRSSR